MNQWNEGNVVVGGLPLHFYRTGGADKPTLLLAHGFSDNGLCWTRVAQKMEAEFDLIMVDARNHGKSGQGICSSDDLADDLAAVISGLSVASTFALGHSMGAGTVAGLAARHPTLVSKIALEDPPWAENPEVEDEATAENDVKDLKNFSQVFPICPMKQYWQWVKSSTPSGMMMNFPLGFNPTAR